MRDGKVYGRRKGDNNREEEKTQFEKIKDELMNMIFGVFYILLKNNESSLWKFGVVLCIQFIQLISYSFESSVSYHFEKICFVYTLLHQILSCLLISLFS